jgi:RND family efflux transporter MFP subunit
MALDQQALATLRTGGVSGSEPPPRRRVRLRPWQVVVLVLLLALAATRLGGKPVEVEIAVIGPPPASGRATVLNASGYVVARRLATVASKVTGRLIEVNVDEGTQVREGQVLARLDPSTVRAAYEVAVSSRAAADRALREIEVRLQDADRMLRRNLELKDRHLVAQSIVDTAEADVNALKARLEQARAEVTVAATTVRQRQQDLDDLVVRAPFTGIVITKDAQPGEMVSPISAGGGFTRTGIATVVDMDSRELEVDVNEAFIHRVHDGQPVEATLDAYPDAPLAAHVIRVVPTADRQKATIKVRIAVDHLEPRILPDMGVKVRFLDESAPEGQRPIAFLAADALQANRVWLVVEGKLRVRPVEVGAAVNGELPVLSGLAAGDKVVLHPSAAFKEGAAVRVKGGG